MADLDLYNQVAQNGRDPILAHVGLVKRTALHLKARIPQVMDVDELIQVTYQFLSELYLHQYRRPHCLYFFLFLCKFFQIPLHILYVF